MGIGKFYNLDNLSFFQSLFKSNNVKDNPIMAKKIIQLFVRPLFEETDAGGRYFILIFI